MRKCTNHPEVKTNLVCHGCGRFFCESCLTFSGAYYYCNDQMCQKSLESERSDILSKTLPEEITCPNCTSVLELDEEERTASLIHCPECECAIDVRVKPFKSIDMKAYSEVLSTINQGDLILLKSILDEAKIDYYIVGENFINIYPLIQPAKFYVVNKQVEEVKELLKDFEFHILGLSTREDDDEK